MFSSNATKRPLHGQGIAADTEKAIPRRDVAGLSSSRAQSYLREKAGAKTRSKGGRGALNVLLVLFGLIVLLLVTFSFVLHMVRNQKFERAKHNHCPALPTVFRQMREMPVSQEKNSKYSFVGDNAMIDVDELILSHKVGNDGSKDCQGMQCGALCLDDTLISAAVEQSLSRTLVDRDWPFILPVGYTMLKEGFPSDEIGFSKRSLVQTENTKQSVSHIKGNLPDIFKHGCQADTGDVAAGFKSSQSWLQSHSHAAKDSCSDSKNGVNLIVQLPRIEAPASKLQEEGGNNGKANKDVGSVMRCGQIALMKYAGEVMQGMSRRLEFSKGMQSVCPEDSKSQKTEERAVNKGIEKESKKEARQRMAKENMQTIIRPLCEASKQWDSRNQDMFTEQGTRINLFSMEHTAAVVASSASTAPLNARIDALPADYSIPEFFLDYLLGKVINDHGQLRALTLRSAIECAGKMSQIAAVFGGSSFALPKVDGFQMSPDAIDTLSFHLTPMMLTIASLVSAILEYPARFCMERLPGWAQDEICALQKQDSVCRRLSGSRCTPVEVDMRHWTRPIPLHVLVFSLHFHVLSDEPLRQPPSVDVLQQKRILSSHDPLGIDLVWPTLLPFATGRLGLRRREFLETLQSNLCNSAVRSITVYQSSQSDVTALRSSGLHDPCNKLRVISKHGRMAYSDAFQTANTEFSGQWTVIGNSDIVLGYDFSPSKIAKHLASKHDLDSDSRVVLMPSRHELQVEGDDTYHKMDFWDGSRHSCCSLPNPNCHDLLVFKPPLPQTIIDNTGFVANTWNSENVVMHEVFQAGYVLANPCNSTYGANFHNHFSQIRAAQNNTYLCETARCAMYCHPGDGTKACEPVIQDYPMSRIPSGFPMIELQKDGAGSLTHAGSLEKSERRKKNFLKRKEQLQEKLKLRTGEKEEKSCGVMCLMQEAAKWVYVKVVRS